MLAGLFRKLRCQAYHSFLCGQARGVTFFCSLLSPRSQTHPLPGSSRLPAAQGPRPWLWLSQGSSGGNCGWLGALSASKPSLGAWRSQAQGKTQTMLGSGNTWRQTQGHWYNFHEQAKHSSPDLTSANRSAGLAQSCLICSSFIHSSFTHSLLPPSFLPPIGHSGPGTLERRTEGAHLLT